MTDRLVRWTAVAAVLSVAAVAALISYRHAVEVVTAHGETGMVGHLYPIVIDGLIIAASMVLLDAARHQERPAPLAWWMLGAGIAATLAVNVLAGLAAGALGGVIASWPALAFVGCYELVMMLVRATAARTVLDPVANAETAAIPSPPVIEVPAVPSDAEHAAEMAFRATHAAGNALSLRKLEARFGLTRSQATKVVQRVLTELGSQDATPADDTHAVPSAA